MPREPGRAELTVETAAGRQAMSYLTDYLAADAADAADPAGQVIAVLGERGTGRTHLATRMYQHARTVLREPALSRYLDASASDFVDLYRRLMGDEPVFTVVRELVNAYYADVVADMLRDRGFDDEIEQGLRSRRLLPRTVVTQLCLRESALLRETRRRLLEVTGVRDLSVALVLLLRAEFDGRRMADERVGFHGGVRDWLAGGEPNELLRERGVTTAMTSEVGALEALTAVVRLCGGQRQRFVLVLDDLLAGVDRPEPDTLRALGTLLEVVAGAGGCLVLTGHPDLPEILGARVWERATKIVELRGFTADEVRSYVTALRAAVTGRQELEPFTPEAVDYLARLAAGDVRTVGRVCLEVYRLGKGSGPVTEDTVREAVRHQQLSRGTAEVLGAVRHVLEANGLPYLRSHLLGAGQDSRADLWVGFDDHGDGCAILLAGSVLDGDDVAAVIRRVFAIRQAAPGSVVVLVVDGLLDDSYTARLREVVGSEPVVHPGRDFSNTLAALVNGAAARLVEVTPDSTGEDVRRRLNQINQQQTSIFTLMEQLLEQFGGMVDTSDRQLTALRKELAVLARPDPLPSEPDRTPRAAPGVPAEVDKIFLDAIGVLDELSRLEETMRVAFTDTTGEVSTMLLRRLRAPHLTSAIGIARLLRGLVVAFRAGITEWYAGQQPDGPLSAVASEQLDLLCGNFAELAEFLPVFHLEPLLQLHTMAARRMTGGRPASGEAVRHVLADLSDRVRTAVRDSADARAG